MRGSLNVNTLVVVWKRIQVAELTLQYLEAVFYEPARAQFGSSSDTMFESASLSFPSVSSDAASESRFECATL
jgi:hypothetical protein